MHPEAISDERYSTALATEIAPRSPWRVVAVKPLPGFRLMVEFVDGIAGTVDMSGLVHSSKAGVFTALADPALFAQVRLDCGAVTWPGELDLAPNAMHDAIEERGEWVL
jgi:hypothetical protein